MAPKLPPLFLTGASGFIGNVLLHALSPLGFRQIYCLTRSAQSLIMPSDGFSPISIIQGDLAQPESYTAPLNECETVVHLAALTGRGAREEFFTSNANNTAILVDRCQRSKQKFLYVSTIAAKFEDQSYYFYAQSKVQAETIVSSSGLPYTIVRPTLVIGRNNQACQKLQQLVRPPFLFILGTGKAYIQPISVDDLVAGLVDIIQRTIFLNETYEFGGPQKISIEEFLRCLYRVCVQKEPQWVIRIPLGMPVALLKLLEKVGGWELPVTAGQFSSFCNDGTIRENELFLKQRSTMKSIEDMVQDLVASN